MSRTKSKIEHVREYALQLIDEYGDAVDTHYCDIKPNPADGIDLEWMKRRAIEAVAEGEYPAAHIETYERWIDTDGDETRDRVYKTIWVHGSRDALREGGWLNRDDSDDE